MNTKIFQAKRLHDVNKASQRRQRFKMNKYNTIQLIMRRFLIENFWNKKQNN